MSQIVLCVDDSATMQKVAEITFRATDFEYVGARSADEALKLAKEKKPAIILADAIMPGKSGYDLCKAAKADPSLAAVPVMVLCGNSEAYDEARGSAAGANGHMTKPWDSQVMIDKVAEVIAAGAGKAAPAPEKVAPPKAPTAPTKVAPPKAPKAPVVTPPTKVPPIAPPKPIPPVQTKAKPEPEVKAPKAPVVPTPKAPVVEAPKAPAVEAPKAPVVQPKAPIVEPAPPVITAPPKAPVQSPATPAGMRPPMIKGTPTKRPALRGLGGGATGNSTLMGMPGLTMPASVSATAAAVAQEAGLDPNGPEMKALLALSRDVVERIVWEVVPDLAEVIIRENLDQLTSKRS